jgi:hypothetical protein
VGGKTRHNVKIAVYLLLVCASMVVPIISLHAQEPVTIVYNAGVAPLKFEAWKAEH